MNYDEVAELDGVPIRDNYRTCSECAGDCYPDPSVTVDGQGCQDRVRVRCAWGTEPCGFVRAAALKAGARA